ncbi:glycoside hydrolase family 9 protein [Fulvivirgaceae bacterium PWU4]|uniref:Glycoside hydrolase family 9 protein n=1 Tax=Chryseosolibacter histidini TaxID=2782349 RepID=A0AAP2GTE5_9BACT|nr:glycoside hydrolase family 9 protein [Chryseosolibacter histidini]MBT1701527.1 glycoside hydrolase family 9 protein [Chryseosolibacter histidini]
MKPVLILLLTTLLLTSTQSRSQHTPFTQQLQQSHHLRSIMKPDSTDMAFTRWQKKKVLRSRTLPLASDLSTLKIKGPGTLTAVKDISVSGQGSVLLETPASLAIKNPSNRSYAFAEVIRPLKNENLASYNRISAWVKLDAPGFYSAFVGVTLYNEGKHIMPTPGRFEGQHFLTVYPGAWQQIIWEIPDLYRDQVTGISVSLMLSGSPDGAADRMKLYVDDLRIEEVVPENTRGFDLRKDALAYSHSGYKKGARKQALSQHTASTRFELLDAGNKVVFSGEGRRLEKDFVEMDFTAFDTPGYYTLKIGNLQSKPFAIGDDAYLATAWRTLNFFFAERCGFDQPGIHQVCHKDIFCVHPNGRRMVVNGGWHDAADLTQGVGNTIRGALAMLELAGSIREKQPDLYSRLLEEARWGINWTLSTRFGDGYRDGGLIVGIWTDNLIGTKDDMETKASNNPFDNFHAAMLTARAVPFYETTDGVFAAWCRKASVEDFQFAEEMIGQALNEKNEAELYAMATTSAASLYELTGDKRYLDKASEFAKVVMACQQMERRKDWSIPLHGFFFESRSRKRPLAYFHQSNEELIIQGLTMLLKNAPDHADAALWKNSCQAYADYLHDISASISPYGVLPAAVYEIGNADFGGIYHEGAQVGMPSMEEYNAQVKKGIALGGNFYLRRFPVAYQFRGFHAIVLGKAKAALMLAGVLKDNKLREIATRQLEYVVGYNSFAMSTIYGDGYDYPPLYGGYAGDVVGAVPVGIETFENDDEPYMPMQVNATYKEIWTHTTAAVMWVVARLFE